MNQRYILLSTVLVASSCLAQWARPRLSQVDFHPAGQITEHPGVLPANGNDRDGGDIVWQEDFANGLAGNNGIGPWTTEGPDGNIWKRAVNGPNGAYTVATQRIQSTTVANGYMLFASDSANTNWTVTPPVIVANPINWEGSLVSPLLDLSATPAVELQFQQRLRWCCQNAPHFLEVSTDGGASWPVSIPTHDIDVNLDPGTQTRSINITAAIAADPSNVKFRFRHSSDAGTSHYHWQLDDLKLVELFADDMKMIDSYLSHTGTGEEYGRIPPGQLNPTMLLGGNAVNNGALEQTNASINMNVTGPVPFSASFPLGTVAVGDTVNGEQDFNLPALSPGLYMAATTVSADANDQIPDNNEHLRNFEVHDGYYSLDGIGNHPAGYETLGALGTNSFTDNEDGLSLLNYYPVREDLTVHGLEIMLATGTLTGGFVIVSLFDTTSVFGEDLSSPLAQSQPTDVTSSDITAGKMRVFFDSPVLLSPEGYYAGVQLFSNAGTGTIRVVDDTTVPQPGVASAIHVPNGSQTGLFSNGTAFGIRMLLSGTVSTEEQGELAGVSMYPNPTTGLLNINTQVSETYTIEVVDMLGKRVLAARANGNTSIDLRGQAKGVYAIHLNSAQGSKVERVTLD